MGTRLSIELAALGTLCAVLVASSAHAGPLGDCAAEGSLEGRTDVVFCEPWESPTWWQQGYVRDGGKANPQPAIEEDVAFTEITMAGCVSGSCLHVKMLKGQTRALAVHWPLAAAGLAPEQLYLRYYIKLGKTFDPYMCDETNTVVGSGGKFPGLVDVRSTSDPSGQCGNGGESADGINCWSMRSVFADCGYTQNGPHNACEELGVPDASIRFGSYLYFFGQASATGSNGLWDSAPNLGPNTGADCQTPSDIDCGLGTGGMFVNDRWYAVEMFVKMNAPGSADGVIRGWVDGAPSFEKTNMIFRIPGHDNLHVRTVWLDVYKGGVSGNCADGDVFLDQMVLATDDQIGALGADGSAAAATATSAGSGGGTADPDGLGGAGGRAGSSAMADPGSPRDDMGGCGCAVPRRQPGGAGALLALLAAVFAAGARSTRGSRRRHTKARSRSPVSVGLAMIWLSLPCACGPDPGTAGPTGSSAATASGSGPGSTGAGAADTSSGATGGGGGAPGTSVIATTAAAMPPRSWKQIVTERIAETLLDDPDCEGLGGNILSYTDVAVWDSESRRVVYIGGDHAGQTLDPENTCNHPWRHVIYDDASNTWSQIDPEFSNGHYLPPNAPFLPMNFPPIVIDSATWSGGVATYHTATPHGFVDGGTAATYNFAPSNWNIACANPTVSVVDAQTFMVPLAEDPGAPGGSNWLAWRCDLIAFQAYHHTAINNHTHTLFHLNWGSPDAGIYRYDDGTWTKLPTTDCNYANPGNGKIVQFHPDFGGPSGTPTGDALLLGCMSSTPGRVDITKWDQGTNAWYPVKTAAMDGDNASGEGAYSIPNAATVMISPHESSRPVRVDNDGSVTELDPAPTWVAPYMAVTTADPVTGEILVADSSNAFWALDPLTGQWTDITSVTQYVIDGLATSGWNQNSAAFSTVATPIPEYGITMWVKCFHGSGCETWLYKHGG